MGAKMKYSSEHFKNKFPKIRPELDSKIKKIYDRQYIDNRQGNSPMSSIAQTLESWMHKQISNTIQPNSRLLEIGAGTLNHLEYESDYEFYDVVEPYQELLDQSDKKKQVTHFYNDIYEVQIKYDYIFSIATLEHLTNLPKVISKAATQLRGNGRFLAAIPSEGGFLWGASWRISTGLEFYIKHRLNYGNLMRHEHVNNFLEIESFLKIIFEEVNKKYLGIGGHLSLYQFFECSKPRMEACNEYTDLIAES